MPTAPAPKLRVSAVDALRGLVMIVMALDHVRDFLHADAFLFSPEDLTRTTPILFFTRWITHFCAPVFMFTAGLGAYLRLQHGGTKRGLSEYLLKRGLWLVFLELTAVRFIMGFSLTTGPLLLEVIWALGVSMLMLAGLVYLPKPALAAVSIAVIALHNLTDPLRGPGPIWTILHQQCVFLVAGMPVVTAYPLMPWFAVMAAGFCFGDILALDPARRRAWMARIGLGMTAAFIVIRAFNVYGDPNPWQTGLLSFLRCAKYPPSLDFILMTLGPAILLLALLDRADLSQRNPLLVFGRAPLFYFLAHLLTIHALSVPLALARYGTAAFMVGALPSPRGPYPAGYGYSLATVYARRRSRVRRPYHGEPPSDRAACANRNVPAAVS